MAFAYNFELCERTYDMLSTEVLYTILYYVGLPNQTCNGCTWRELVEVQVLCVVVALVVVSLVVLYLPSGGEYGHCLLL